MFSLQIGMAMEGPTDAIVAKAGLSAFLNTSFTTLTLQPQIPPGKTGAGWSGVFWWCRQVASQGYSNLIQSPALAALDVIIIQVDADVAATDYQAGNIEAPPFNDLPCEHSCPPASDTVHALYQVVLGWLQPAKPEERAVICIPSKCIEAWAAAALYGRGDPQLLEELECYYEVISYLQKKPAKERLIRMQSEPGKPPRLRKVKKKFEDAQEIITKRWNEVKDNCPQAARFQEAVEAALT